MAKVNPRHKTLHNSMLGAGGGGSGFGMVGRTSSAAAKAQRSGSSVAKNYRASGKAGSSTAKQKTDYKGAGKSILRILGF